MQRRFERLTWLPAACTLLLGSCREATSPQRLRYDLTFDDGWGISETALDTVQVRLVLRDTLTAYDISWSPDGRQVAFTRQYQQAGQYSYRVVVFDAIDGSQRVLTQGPDDSAEPAWSPDGSAVAYLSRPPDAFDASLRIVRPDGTGDMQLGSLAYYVRPPRWSPDGRQIAATRNDFNVVVVDAATGSLVRAIGPGISPTWSPDGQQLAFVSNGITIADQTGTIRRVIPRTGYDPAWSPDGAWIAFDGLGVYVMPASAVDTTGIRLVAAGFSRPAWRLRQ